jgi:3-oxoacyl-[acyl-carrier protein] reductase
VVNYTSDSSTEKATALVTELQETYSVKAIPAQADLGSVDGPAKLVSIVKDHFSKNSEEASSSSFQIDIIINNAGIVRPGALGTVTADDFQDQYNVNVRGPILLVQAALPYLPTNRSGRIVNISSVGCSVGFFHETLYAGSKGALEAMTRVWARELAERATVNSVNVGPIDTGDEGMFNTLPEDMLQKVWAFNKTVPLSAVREGVDNERVQKTAAVLGGRSAYPDEVAGVVVMLCLPEAGWTTGGLVGANGGLVFGR